jgi:hypothetical protein
MIAPYLLDEFLERDRMETRAFRVTQPRNPGNSDRQDSENRDCNGDVQEGPGRGFRPTLIVASVNAPVACSQSGNTPTRATGPPSAVPV